MPSLSNTDEYQECAELANYGALWMVFPGEKDLLCEIWEHRRTCEICKSNRQVVDNWRTAKMVKDQIGEDAVKIGMLWYDNDPNTDVNQKIKKAVEYYEKKYGKKANVCYVRQADSCGQVDGVNIRESRALLQNHYWIGIEQGGE